MCEKTGASLISAVNQVHSDIMLDSYVRKVHLLSCLLTIKSGLGFLTIEFMFRGD